MPIVINPATRDAALAAYNALRAENPHLPPAETVADTTVEFAFGPATTAVLRLSVIVDIPTSWQSPHTQPEDTPDAT